MGYSSGGLALEITVALVAEEADCEADPGEGVVPELHDLLQPCNEQVRPHMTRVRCCADAQVLSCAASMGKQTEMAKKKRQQEGERNRLSQAFKPQGPEGTEARSAAVVNLA